MNTETNNKTLMRGDKVVIYQDPITQLKPEDEATLSSWLKTDGNLEQWNVRFKGEREVYPRWIAKSEAART
jgi:hypothetical protein